MKRILVTGIHRSGTTWVGKMLSAGRQVTYVHEPFNVDHSQQRFGLPINHWFSHYADIADQAGLDAGFQDILAYRRLGYTTDGRPSGTALKLKHWIKRHYGTLLIKDPLALLSAAHLSQAYNMQVVCMIRHPLAFCGSIKKWRWDFPFGDWLAQPHLMQNRLADYRDQIELFAQSEQDIVDQGILLWNALHHVIHNYQSEHPDWIFLRHEELTQDPVESFEEVYRKLGLPFTRRARQTVVDSVRSMAGETQDHNYKPRDPSKVLKTWQDRLTDEEMARVNEQTHRLATVFYPDGLPGNVPGSGPEK